MSSPRTSRYTFEQKRKRCLNIFLWSHIFVFIMCPAILFAGTAIILKKGNITSFEQLLADKAYIHWLIISLVVGVTTNFYIMIMLSICQGRAVYGLKKHFGVAFKKETNQISAVLVAFNVTFFIRAVYEGYLGYINQYSIPKGHEHYPC